MRITKSDGTLEAFDIHKLLSSLRRSGADEHIAKYIADEVAHGMHDGASTHEIYAQAFAKLREYKHVAAARYSLKRAILQFGPSGFPFEAYLAKLFEAEGYQTSIDQLVKGRCVEHEVDVVMKKGEETTYVEAKFHNDPGYKCDLKTVLYVKARMDDIKGTGLVVTNTKFTSHAIAYAQCVGMELLGWDHPQGNGLHERIDRAKVYPVTALTTLSRREKTALLEQKVVLCNEFASTPDALVRAGISPSKAEGVLAEAAILCAPGNDV